MLIKELINTDIDLEISGLSVDAAKVNSGELFFCLKSDNEINAQNARKAQSLGAAAIVAEQYIGGVDLPQCIVPDARSAMAIVAHRFYGKPAEKLKIIGITGTNGKTTTSYIVKSILDKAGHKTGLIGTNEIIIAGRHLPPLLTTPDPIDLHRHFAAMVAEGVDIVVMEVSAHALALRKLDGIKFTVAAFTNLTPDHLDFFNDMTRYRRAKMQLFTPERAQAAVVNVDDQMGIDIYLQSGLPTVTYGCENPSDVFGIDYVSTAKGCSFVANIMDGIINIKYCGAGRFNMYNVLCAAAVTRLLGVPLSAMKSGIAALKKIPGRINVISKADKNVVIDYAHTPDGLANIIRTVREFTDGKVITVFGCGGDRDRTKRAIMGEIACELSDFAVITSDNPRSELPMSIIADIVKGAKTNNYEMEEDRELAIKHALELCNPHDTVIIAGKGHENTQEIAGVKVHFQDEEIVERLLK